MNLAVYACDARLSRGRRHVEAAIRVRDDFERDRDRIVHSTSFRRLVYKTQVFVNHEGDLFRTRLTHSLEVAQLARSMARALGLNEALVEAIALAHDLGHTPFGHAGQDALNECMHEHGGFEHNLQSLRVVDCLESRYPEFDGLNLTFESREGILKQCSRRNAQALEQAQPGDVGARFILGGQPSLEAQVANLADEIAYNAHDIDDGVRSGLLSLQELVETVALVRRFHDEAVADYPSLVARSDRRLLFETIRRMLSSEVQDLVDTSRAALAAKAPTSAEVARKAGALIRLSDSLHEQAVELKRVLHLRLYRHAKVMQTMEIAAQVVRDLFNRYLTGEAPMPEDFACRADRHRAIADYVSGMTDRYASSEHRRMTGRDLFAQS